MKKLFTNDKFFMIAVVIAVIGNISNLFYCIYKGLDVLGMDAMSSLIATGCLIGLQVSYNKHQKNVMKGMMGALLASVVISCASMLHEIEFTIDYVIAPVTIILALGLFANHFIINESHEAGPVNIRVNQILVMLIAIAMLMWNAIWFPYSDSWIGLLTTIVYMVGFVFTMVSVVCVESRLDAYRLDREAAGWTEEKGYPEGYVHGYEKEKE